MFRTFLFDWFFMYLKTNFVILILSRFYVIYIFATYTTYKPLHKPVNIDTFWKTYIFFIYINFKHFFLTIYKNESFKTSAIKRNIVRANTFATHTKTEF